MTLLFALIACQPTCPTGQTCQAPQTAKPSATPTLTDVNTYLEGEFYKPGTGGDASSATELHDGLYGVVSRNSSTQHSSMGFVTVRGDVGGGVAPTANNTETYCASRGFAWPQFLAGGNNPPVVSWTVLPTADADTPQAKCNGAPWRLDTTFNTTSPYTEHALDTSPTKAGVKNFYVKRCTNGANCPAASQGTPDTSGTRATTLRPGVYSLVSRGIHIPAGQGTDSVVSGAGLLFVRPATGQPNWFLETYCYDGTFRWPRVVNQNSPTGAGELWTNEMVVTPKVDASGAPETAPATPVCTAPYTNRADYCFSTDPNDQCVIP